MSGANTLEQTNGAPESAYSDEMVLEVDVVDVCRILGVVPCHLVDFDLSVL